MPIRSSTRWVVLSSLVALVDCGGGGGGGGGGVGGTSTV